MRREWESLVINNKVKARIVLGRSRDFFYYSLNRYTSSNNLDSAVVHAALISGSVSTSLFSRVRFGVLVFQCYSGSDHLAK